MSQVFCLDCLALDWRVRISTSTGRPGKSFRYGCTCQWKTATTHCTGGEYSLKKGDTISPEELQQRLQLLGYQERSTSLLQPGEYVLLNNTFSIRLKGSQKEPVTVSIEQEKVTRLEPLITDNRGSTSLYLGRPLLTRYVTSFWEIRRTLPLNEMPEALIHAVLAAEDRRYFEHPGVDARGIVRAALANLTSRSIRQGGSTISQQLIKTFLQRTSRTYKKKALEAVLAMQLELSFSKEQILNAYLNNVYMGHVGPFSLQGMASASRYVLGKKLEDLSPGECALLAVMIRSPNALSPVEHPTRNLTRAANLLIQLKEEGKLEKTYLFDPKNQYERLSHITQKQLLALPWAWQTLERELRRYELPPAWTQKRLVLEISLDPYLQTRAQQLVEKQLQTLEQQQKSHLPLEGALVSLEQNNGAIRAVVGGKDYMASQFNRAILSQRPIGSLVKPFVYLAAMAAPSRSPLQPNSPVADTPLKVKVGSQYWRPANYDHRFQGMISLKNALITSRNIPAVRMGLRAGVENVSALISKTGINDHPQPYPSIFLGSCASNTLRMASAYATIAMHGKYMPAQLVDRAIVSDTVVVLRRPAFQQIIDKNDCITMESMLRGVLTHGSGRLAQKFGIPPGMSGKTGTTSDSRDAWFAGFSDKMTTVVWIGNDANKDTNLTGGKAALPIWALNMGGKPLTLQENERIRTPSPETRAMAASKKNSQIQEVQQNTVTLSSKKKKMLPPRQQTASAVASKAPLFFSPVVPFVAPAPPPAKPELEILGQTTRFSAPLQLEQAEHPRTASALKSSRKPRSADTLQHPQKKQQLTRLARKTSKHPLPEQEYKYFR